MRLIEEGQQVSLIIDGERVGGVLIVGLNEHVEHGRRTPPTVKLAMPAPVTERVPQYLTVPLDRIELAPSSPPAPPSA